MACLIFETGTIIQVGKILGLLQSQLIVVASNLSCYKFLFYFSPYLQTLIYRLLPSSPVPNPFSHFDFYLQPCFKNVFPCLLVFKPVSVSLSLSSAQFPTFSKSPSSVFSNPLLLSTQLLHFQTDNDAQVPLVCYWPFLEPVFYSLYQC